MQSLLKFQRHFSQRKKKNPKILEMWVLSPIQSCLTLCYLVDCSPSGYSVHGTLQAKILECVAMPFSRESSRPRDQTQIYLNCRQILYCLSHLGSSNKYYKYIYIYKYVCICIYISSEKLDPPPGGCGGCKIQELFLLLRSMPLKVVVEVMALRSNAGWPGSQALEGSDYRVENSSTPQSQWPLQEPLPESNVFNWSMVFKFLNFIFKIYFKSNEIPLVNYLFWYWGLMVKKKQNKTMKVWSFWLSCWPCCRRWKSCPHITSN